MKHYFFIIGLTATFLYISSYFFFKYNFSEQRAQNFKHFETRLMENDFPTPLLLVFKPISWIDNCSYYRSEDDMFVDITFHLKNEWREKNGFPASPRP